ncbi:MAG: PAS domain S-box protein [Thermoguttaceae bacterium]|nr:PAS domain S-box protein [Thermoguttaceae bacterium]MDW8039246.1 PAS domain S-box protein [Thermoguttaceae bacterium]
MAGMGEKILLVEDDPEMVRLVVHLLEAEGYVVQSAPDAQSAWKLCQTDVYDGLVVDYRLPDQNGLELLRRFADRQSLPPTIMLTGVKQEEVEIAAIQLGVETFLPKDSAGLFRRLLPIYLERALKRARIEKEKQQTETELRAHWQMFHAISETALDAIIVMDHQGRIAHWNPAAERIFGYRAEEAIGQDVHRLLAPPEHQAQAAQGVAHFLKTGQGPVLGKILELEALRKDGVRIPIELSVAEIPKSPCCRAAAIVRDISARKRAEAELQHRTEELAFRLKELHCLFSIYRLLEETEGPWEETLGKAIRLIPLAWQYPETACARIVLQNQVFATDNFQETPWKLAAPIWVADQLAGALEICYLRPLPEADLGPFLKEEKGLLELVANHLGHIIEHLQAQQQIRDLKRQIEFVLQATRTGLFITDLERNLLYVDPGIQQIYGDPRGRKCYEYFTNSHTHCAVCPVGNIVEGQVVQYEATLPKEGHRPVQIISTAFRDEKGRLLIANVGMDLTERKRMEAALLQSQKLEAIGRLAAGIAHEINTPAQYIRSNLHFLQEAFEALRKALAYSGQQRPVSTPTPSQPPSELQQLPTPNGEDLDYLCEEIPKAIEQSIKGVEEIAAIVRAIRSTQPAATQKEQVDLNEVIQSTLTLCRNEWKQVAELVTDLDPQLPLILGVPHDLHQVVFHLVINAAQAIQEAQQQKKDSTKGTIIVSTRQKGAWVEMQIADTGIGIPPENLPKIFEPFFTTRPVGQGKGQGLTIARSIVVDGHGGTIEVESQPGQGATFVVRLPVQPPAEAPAAVTSLALQSAFQPLHADMPAQKPSKKPETIVSKPLDPPAPLLPLAPPGEDYFSGSELLPNSVPQDAKTRLLLE